MQIRRVVTGHDAEGNAVVEIDEISKDIISNRKGAQFANLWSTSGFPADNTVSGDAAKLIQGTTRDNGSVFRIVEYAPGAAPRNHRTDSIDYAVVLSGEIDMVLDKETVRLRAGDVLVQRGTVHDWVNKGTVNCLIAFVLISAKPVTTAGKTLQAHG